MVFRPLGGVFHRHPVFNTMALDSGDAAVGVLSYNADKDTFDLTHKDGVVQQLGQEIYGHFINNTAATIENGTAVGFAGANGEIEIQPYIADVALSLDAIPATAFSPAGHSVILNVSQLQL